MTYKISFSSRRNMLSQITWPEIQALGTHNGYIARFVKRRVCKPAKETPVEDLFGWIINFHIRVYQNYSLFLNIQITYYCYVVAFQVSLERSRFTRWFEVPESLHFEQKLKFWTNPVTLGTVIFRKNFDYCTHCELEVPRISADFCMSALGAYMCACVYILYTSETKNYRFVAWEQ